MEIPIITGLTASGKSKFALEYAEKNNGVIINADCIQVYKFLQILNASPTQSDKKNISHLLYNFLNIDEAFDVIQWLQLCIDSILSCINNNKTPIIVGGTGFYISTFLEYVNYIKTNKSNFSNLFKNIQYNIDIFNKTQYKLIAFLPSNYKIKFNIEKRLSEMLYLDSIINEVKELSILKTFNIKLPITKTIGFNSIYKYIQKSHSKNKMIYDILKETTEYAKRQRTWIKNKMTADWSVV